MSCIVNVPMEEHVGACIHTGCSDLLSAKLIVQLFYVVQVLSHNTSDAT